MTRMPMPRERKASGSCPAHPGEALAGEGLRAPSRAPPWLDGISKWICLPPGIWHNTPEAGDRHLEMAGEPVFETDHFGFQGVSIREFPMPARSSPSLISFRFFSQACGFIAAGFGMAAIAGWLMEWRILAGMRPDYIPMAPNTALSFIVLGISLCTLVTERKWGLKLSRLGAALILILALVRFAEFHTNMNLDVDQWIFQVPGEKLGLVPVGRMALPTALNFLVASVALFLASCSKTHWIAGLAERTLAGVTTLIGLAFSLGYVYGAPLLYGGTTIPMALNTAIAFFVLGLGLVINSVGHDLAERKQAAEALKKAHDEL
ncbi:MAG: hypothetical protein M1550_03925, partial [Deltaproteobacteria bacterium]|nr:hypothetical protein [Deltaproteobacteria bacterium]